MVEVVTTRPADGVAVLTLNDPPRRNALGIAMADALQAAVVGLHGDAELRCVVLTGAPPAFCAGGDLSMLHWLAGQARSGQSPDNFLLEFYGKCLGFRRLAVPIVAAINGHAMGAGLAIALACDIRVVAREAKLGLNFSRLGLYPGMGTSWLLPRIAGSEVAARMLYTGTAISGQAAVAAGLALCAEDADNVVPAALELARQVALSSPSVVRRLVASLRGDGGETFPEALLQESRDQAADLASQDFAERLAAVSASGRHR